MAVVPPELLPPRARALAPVPTTASCKNSAPPTRPVASQFFGEHAHLAEPKAFAAYLAPLRKIEWVPLLKVSRSADPRRCSLICRAIPTASPSPTAGSSPSTRTASPSSGRIIAPTAAPLQDHDAPTDEFIRRFLIHVLPHGFHRIRHYGLFANGNRAANIARARELLTVPSRLKQPEMSEPAVERSPACCRVHVPAVAAE